MRLSLPVRLCLSFATLLRGASPLPTELHSDCTHTDRKLKRIVVARVRRMSSGRRIKCPYFTPEPHVRQAAKLRGFSSYLETAPTERAQPTERATQRSSCALNPLLNRPAHHVPNPAAHNITSKHHRPVPEAHCWGHPSVPLHSSAGASPAPPLDLNCQREPSVAARTDLNCVHTAPEAGRWHEQSPDGFAAALQ